VRARRTASEPRRRQVATFVIVNNGNERVTTSKLRTFDATQLNCGASGDGCSSDILAEDDVSAKPFLNIHQLDAACRRCSHVASIRRRVDRRADHSSRQPAYVQRRMHGCACSSATGSSQPVSPSQRVHGVRTQRGLWLQLKQNLRKTVTETVSVQFDGSYFFPVTTALL